MSYAGDIIKEIGEATVKGINSSIQVKLQKNRFTNWLTDYAYYGFDGGSLTGIREIYVDSNDRVIGMRDYTKSEGPITNLNDIQFENGVVGNKITDYSSGMNVFEKYKQGSLFDTRFDVGGSASRLTNGDYGELSDYTRMRRRLMTTDVKYSVARGPRRTLYDQVGNPSQIQVIDVSCARGLWGGLFKDFDLRGYDLGRIIFRAVQTFVYKGLDELIFDPLVERSFKLLKEADISQEPLDGIITMEHNAVNDVVETLYALPSELDIAA